MSPGPDDRAETFRQIETLSLSLHGEVQKTAETGGLKLLEGHTRTRVRGHTGLITPALEERQACEVNTAPRESE